MNMTTAIYVTSFVSLIAIVAVLTTFTWLLYCKLDDVIDNQHKIYDLIVKQENK